jgi:hypothetical protein
MTGRSKRRKTVHYLLSIAAFPLCIAYAPAASAEWAMLPAYFSIWSGAYDADVIRIGGVSASITNPAGCADPDSYMVRTTLTKETKARIYATLLLAKAIGKSVTIWVNGCESARPAIETVIIE